MPLLMEWLDSYLPNSLHEFRSLTLTLARSLTVNIIEGCSWLAYLEQGHALLHGKEWVVHSKVVRLPLNYANGRLCACEGKLNSTGVMMLQGKQTKTHRTNLDGLTHIHAPQ